MNCPFCNGSIADGNAYCPRCGVSLNEPHLRVGTLLRSRYRIEEVLGAGGWGITYKGYDTHLNRCVAIKELFPSGCTRNGRNVCWQKVGSSSLRDEYKRRFLEEARILAKLNHDSIVKVYEYFEENDTVYMVMEFVDGETLEEKTEALRGPMSEEEAVQYILQVCEALKVVHENGYLHRDIKPSNIMVRSNGKVVLIDFGIARPFADGQMTTGVGTPCFGAGEQFKSQSYGPPADIYALGATLYYLLTAREPVPAIEREAAGIDLLPVRKLNPKVSPCVEEAVTAAMRLEPRNRPQSVSEFVGLLQPGPAAKVTKLQPSRNPTPPRPWLSVLVGKQVGKVTGALSGAAVGLGVGLLAGLLLLAASAIVGAITGALGLAIVGAEAGGDEGCFAILAGLVIGAVIGYLLGVIVGSLLGLAATVSGLAIGGVQGTQIGMNVGGYLSTRWGAVPTSLLLGALTSGIIGMVWSGTVLCVTRVDWTEAVPLVGLFMALGAMAGGGIGSLTFWAMVRRQGGQMPSSERLTALISVPVGIGLALWLFSTIRTPQVWLDVASVWDRWYALIEYRLRYGSWPGGWGSRTPSTTPQYVEYQVRYVYPSKATVHAEMRRSARVVAVVKRGQPVYVIAISKDGAWAFVKLPSGKKGYVVVNSLGVEPPPKKTPATRRAPDRSAASPPSSLPKRPTPSSKANKAIKDGLAPDSGDRRERTSDTLKVLEFGIDPSVISAGDSVTLRWRVQGASRVIIDNGVGEVASQGEIVIIPLQDTITLTAVNNEGKTVTRTVKVTVANTPVVTPPPTENPLTGH